jgi:hypothetical protein
LASAVAVMERTANADAPMMDKTIDVVFIIGSSRNLRWISGFGCWMPDWVAFRRAHCNGFRDPPLAQRGKI